MVQDGGFINIKLKLVCKVNNIPVWISSQTLETVLCELTLTDDEYTARYRGSRNSTYNIVDVLRHDTANYVCM